MSKPRGRISTEYWVSCGECYTQEPLAEIRHYGSPTENAKADGWHYTKDAGWLCEQCASKRKARGRPPKVSEGQ